MNGLQAVEAVIPGFMITGCVDVLELALTQVQPGDLNRTLRLRLAHARYERYQIILTCAGVSQFEIDPDFNMQVVGFDVHDITNRQWDGLFWEVLDYENQNIHFYCRDITIEAVEA